MAKAKKGRVPVRRQPTRQRSEATQRTQPPNRRTKAPIAVDRSDPREKALRLMMERGASQASAAREHGISAGRLRRYLRRNTKAKFDGRKWRIVDKRPRPVLIASDGRAFAIDADAKAASKVGVWWNDVARFLKTNRKAELAVLQGRSVRDVHGKTHWLEDRPNVLRRLRAADELSFLTIYADTSAGGDGDG